MFLLHVICWGFCMSRVSIQRNQECFQDVYLRQREQGCSLHVVDGSSERVGWGYGVKASDLLFSSFGGAVELLQ